LYIDPKIEPLQLLADLTVSLYSMPVLDLLEREGHWTDVMVWDIEAAVGGRWIKLGDAIRESLAAHDAAVRGKIAQAIAVEKQALRQHPTCVQACQTESVMHDFPTKFVAKSRRHIVDDWKLIHAGRRLDWLFRRALACDNEWGCLDAAAICAIEDFIAFIEAALPGMHLVTAQGRNEINPRIAFGKMLLDLDRRERIFHQWQPNHNIQYFENFVIQHGFTMDEMVFQNPFHWVGTSTDHNLNYFHILMKHFWE
jgi:hypothetical protein